MNLPVTSRLQTMPQILIHIYEDFEKLTEREILITIKEEIDSSFHNTEMKKVFSLLFPYDATCFSNNNKDILKNESFGKEEKVKESTAELSFCYNNNYKDSIRLSNEDNNNKKITKNDYNHNHNYNNTNDSRKIEIINNYNDIDIINKNTLDIKGMSKISNIKKEIEKNKDTSKLVDCCLVNNELKNIKYYNINNIDDEEDDSNKDNKDSKENNYIQESINSNASNSVVFNKIKKESFSNSGKCFTKEEFVRIIEEVYSNRKINNINIDGAMNCLYPEYNEVAERKRSTSHYNPNYEVSYYLNNNSRRNSQYAVNNHKSFMSDYNINEFELLRNSFKESFSSPIKMERHDNNLQYQKISPIYDINNIIQPSVPEYFNQSSLLIKEEHELERKEGKELDYKNRYIKNNNIIKAIDIDIKNNNDINIKEENENNNNNNNTSLSNQDVNDYYNYIRNNNYYVSNSINNNPNTLTNDFYILSNSTKSNSKDAHKLCHSQLEKLGINSNILNSSAEKTGHTNNTNFTNQSNPNIKDNSTHAYSSINDINKSDIKIQYDNENQISELSFKNKIIGNNNPDIPTISNFNKKLDLGNNNKNSNQMYISKKRRRSCDSKLANSYYSLITSNNHYSLNDYEHNNNIHNNFESNDYENTNDTNNNANNNLNLRSSTKNSTNISTDYSKYHSYSTNINNNTLTHNYSNYNNNNNNNNNSNNKNITSSSPSKLLNLNTKLLFPSSNKKFQPLGLKEISNKVKLIIKNSQKTSYKEISDQIVKEVDHLNNQDSKNIRRRIYDALNVIKALGLFKNSNDDSKSIIWNTEVNQSEKNEELQKQIGIQKEEIKKKQLRLDSIKKRIKITKTIIDYNKRNCLNNNSTNNKNNKDINIRINKIKFNKSENKSKNNSNTQTNNNNNNTPYFLNNTSNNPNYITNTKTHKIIHINNNLSNSNMAEQTFPTNSNVFSSPFFVLKYFNTFSEAKIIQECEQEKQNRFIVTNSSALEIIGDQDIFAKYYENICDDYKN